MTEIRTKDRLFLAAVVPLALACAYFFYLRPSAAAKLKMLEDLDRTTVTHEEYPGEKRLRSAALTQAQANLVAEQNIKPPASEVAGHAGDGSQNPQRPQGRRETLRSRKRSYRADNGSQVEGRERESAVAPVRHRHG